MAISIRIVKMVLTHLHRIPFWAMRFSGYAKKPETRCTQVVQDDMKTLIGSLNRAARVNMEFSGLEKLPEQNGYVLYPNHQGMYDPLALLGTMEAPFSIIYKKELEHVPFLHLALDALDAKPMDRKDVRQSMNVINTVAKEVAGGRNYAIFAEGTRNKDGNNVHEMKGGSFKIAYKAKCPIVPVAFIDSYRPLDEKSLKPVTIQLHFLDPIPYEEYKDKKAVEIAAEVRRRIQQAIIDHLPEDRRDTVRIEEFEKEVSAAEAAE